MTANSQRKLTETDLNVTFASGLLLGLLLGIVFSRPRPVNRQKQRSRNLDTLRSALNEAYASEERRD